MKLALGQKFGVALCEHFGVDPKVASDAQLFAGYNEVLSATISVYVTAEDLEAIAVRMQQQ